MNQESKITEAVAYFRSNPGFNRLFRELLKKYRSLGRLGGQVLLAEAQNQEIEALSSLVRKNFQGQRQLLISVRQLRLSLKKSRFSEIELEEVLAAYWGEALISQKEARADYEGERLRFFAELRAHWGVGLASKWLEDILTNKENSYRILMHRYQEDRRALQQDLEAVARGLAALPVQQQLKERLAVFAARVTKNPHAFDINTAGGQLLVAALAYSFQKPRPQDSEARAELYYQAGLLTDEVSSFVVVAGLEAYTKEGELHQGWVGFNQRGETLVVNLGNLSSLAKVVSPRPKVYIVENPGVFASLVENQKKRPVSLVCTFGQLKVAALVLLDLLAASGALFYYSGDFDPEGLQIADKLAQRYGKRLFLWHYGLADYQKTLSQEAISQPRLKKLANLQHSELKILAQSLQTKRLAGYQEVLLPELLADI